MGKNGSGHASEGGSSDTNADGVVETDPTDRFLRYNDVLGKGAYKKVYKAFDQIDGIEVAWNKVSIEKMLQSSENLSRLYSEVHFLKTLRHENILKFHSSWVDDTNRYINIITELFTSGSLRTYRKKHEQVDFKAIKNWARQILRGLVYLHSQKPPIIHRDLKCDNIFINGNNGEVKIGDLGLATMMLQAKARSVLGTPEFMAPELYEEEYNELVDIYSFGMCMLEMVTLDYPYSECHNAAQIFKRVTSGVKPAALEKVTNMEVRRFIEQCLVPASERKSAKELLEDPFLQCTNSQGTKPNEIPTSIPPPKSHVSTSAKEPVLDVEAECRANPISGSVEASYYEAHLPMLEFVRVNRDVEFSLKGGRVDDNSVFFLMRITDANGDARNVHFTFYLDSDTSLGVVSEMVEQLELADYDVPFLSEFIDYLIMCLIPDWRPLSEELPNGDIASTVENGSPLENKLTLENNLPLENRSDDAPNRLSSNSTLVDGEAACEGLKADSGNSPTPVQLEEVKSNSSGPSPSLKLSGTNACATDVDSAVVEFRNREFGESSTPPNGYHDAEAIGGKPLNGFNLQCLDEDDEEGLQSEIDDIKEHYKHLFEELNRMQEVALENARKRWMRKLGKRAA